MRVGFAGDWHVNLAWVETILHKFVENDITHVVHVGDFGVGWPGLAGQDYKVRVQELAAQYGITLFVIPGNHENYVTVNNVPVADDGWQHWTENILLAPRGHRWVWGGRSFVALGGANSIDRFEAHRIANISWWEDEQISLGDIYRTVAGGKADVMVTHDAPLGVNPMPEGKEGFGWGAAALQYAYKSRLALRQAVDGVKPEILLHGHFHHFHDTTAQLNDGMNDYVIRVVGLDKDDTFDNIGILDTDDLSFALIR